MTIIRFENTFKGKPHALQMEHDLLPEHVAYLSDGLTRILGAKSKGKGDCSIRLTIDGGEVLRVAGLTAQEFNKRQNKAFDFFRKLQ